MLLSISVASHTSSSVPSSAKIDPKYLTLNNELNADKSVFLQRFLPIYLDILNQKFSSIIKTEVLFNESCKKSIVFEAYLKSIFENVFTKLDNLKISWDNELDIEPVERFLSIRDKVPFSFPTTSDFLKRDRYEKHSDIEFNKIKQEFTSFLKERENTNLLSVGIDYCYGNIILPKSFEIIFDTKDLTKFWEQKTIVRYAFNYKTYFHTDLWRGHHSHCFIEVIGDIPDIFNELPNNDGGKTIHNGIGLCTKYDWQYIKNK